ncbi:MAG: YhcN/YlaJ family sporulation lipoprotein [Corallococcus sp.]|nr:YhcN/YlaJ family sporulation lipoprotein [Corallococcus sp.]
MKKFFLACLALLTLSLFVIPSAYAMTKTEQQIADDVKNMDNVKDAVVVIYGDKCVIALRTQKVIKKSQCNEIKNAVRETALKADGKLNDIFVTCNVKVFVEAEKIAQMDENQRQQAIETLLDRLANPPFPKHFDMPEHKSPMIQD